MELIEAAVFSLADLPDRPLAESAAIFDYRSAFRTGYLLPRLQHGRTEFGIVFALVFRHVANLVLGSYSAERVVVAVSAVGMYNISINF